MENPDLQETAWARGRADTAKAMHSLWFWIVDAGGGAVIGAISGWWAVLWVVGCFVCVWIGATASAPIKQRNEARDIATKILGKSATWLDMETGGRYYRDLLVESGMTDGVQSFDSMASPHPEQPTSNPIASAFRWIVEEGINTGEMEVWGVPENGSKPEKLVRVEDNASAYRRSREGDSMFLMMNGVYYRDLQIKRSSIKSYVDHVRRHDAELKRRASEQKTE